VKYNIYFTQIKNNIKTIYSTLPRKLEYPKLCFNTIRASSEALSISQFSFENQLCLSALHLENQQMLADYDVLVGQLFVPVVYEHGFTVVSCCLVRSRQLTATFKRNCW